MGNPTFDDLYCDGVERSALLHYRLSVKVLSSEYIGVQGEPGELKHLSTRRKGHQRDSVSSGERTRTRPVLLQIESEPSGKSGRRG